MFSSKPLETLAKLQISDKMNNQASSHCQVYFNTPVQMKFPLLSQLLQLQQFAGEISEDFSEWQKIVQRKLDFLKWSDEVFLRFIPRNFGLGSRYNDYNDFAQ